VKKITSFKVMDILEKAIEMDDVIHLEIGEPDFDTPEEIKEEGIRAIREEKIGYTHSFGMKKLREAVAEYYNSHYGTSIRYDNVVVTSGTSPALILGIEAILEYSGKKEILASNPGYACYPNFVSFLNGELITYELDLKNGFKQDIQAIKSKITDNTAAILINSPCNPTGVVMSPEDYRELAGLGVTIISDEIYQGLVYEGKRYDSILNYTENAIVLNGFSKLFAMTGWRLGYVIVPDKYLDLTQKLAQNLFISPNTISQYAAIEALTNSNVEKKIDAMAESYNTRRLFALDELQKQGLEIAAIPQGAYYIIIDVRKFTNDSLKFCYDLLMNARVAVTPGIDFGSNLEGCIRISYATSIENLKEGINRLGKYLNSLKNLPHFNEV
jgi:aspartate/methionine/tyrosine aminotransferase